MDHQTVDVAMNGKAAEMFTQQGKERSASSHRSSNGSQNNFMLSNEGEFKSIYCMFSLNMKLQITRSSLRWQMQIRDFLERGSGGEQGGRQDAKVSEEV